MRQRFAAKSAKRQDDQFAARNLAVHLFKFGHRRCRQRLQRCLRQMRVALCDIERVASPFNQLHAQRKALFADIIANDIKRGLIVGVADPALHGRLQRRHVAG